VNYVFKAIASPVGLLKLVARDAGLAAVLWENDDPHRVRIGPMVRNPRTCSSSKQGGNWLLTSRET
jgi:methylated-DNA-[protein]-cysteine S-methyltransferase